MMFPRKYWFGVVTLALLMAFTLPPSVQAQATNCAQIVTVRAGDTLSSIAGRTLGNAAAYDRIVAATNAAAASDSSSSSGPAPQRKNDSRLARSRSPMR